MLESDYLSCLYNVVYSVVFDCLTMFRVILYRTYHSSNIGKCNEAVSRLYENQCGFKSDFMLRPLVWATLQRFGPMEIYETKNSVNMSRLDKDVDWHHVMRTRWGRGSAMRAIFVVIRIWVYNESDVARFIAHVLNHKSSSSACGKPANFDYSVHPIHNCFIHLSEPIS